MEHLSYDHKDRPNKREDIHKLCDEKGHWRQIVCKDSSSLFEKLLEKENSATFHHRNIKNLAIQ